MSTLERIVHFEAAYDKRSPEPSKNYGIHGVTLRMALKGDKGAVSFTLYTNWQLPHVTEEFDAKPVRRGNPHLLCHPMPADLGYHSFTPHYEEQGTMAKCDLLGQPCYYDGSSLNADPVYERLLREGDAGVWGALEKYYKETFEK